MTPILNLFTGIVQGKARVRSVDTKNASSADALSLRTFEIQFPQESTDIETVKVGASIALNGTCLTVTSTSLDDSVATFDVIEETLKRTNLGSLEENSSVNFERSARVGDEIGGHTVSGHVQTTAMVTKVTTADDGTVRMDFELRDPSWMKYILSKGFVAVDGCSLTVGEVDEKGFCVYLIPETLRVTVLGDRDVGDHVNIEVEAQTQAIVDTVERVVARYMVEDAASQ
ncbi:hypothetical protein M9434_001402 [Picochlorum sp. BPE23]|nr:hypothetical protein M9434_001402 [Picochlorum sp. BPE23]